MILRRNDLSSIIQRNYFEMAEFHDKHPQLYKHDLINFYVKEWPDRSVPPSLCQVWVTPPSKSRNPENNLRSKSEVNLSSSYCQRLH